MIRFIDYGDCEEVSVESLKSLPDGDLRTLPPQVCILVVFAVYTCGELVLFLYVNFLTADC